MNTISSYFHSSVDLLEHYTAPLLTSRQYQITALAVAIIVSLVVIKVAVRYSRKIHVQQTAQSPKKTVYPSPTTPPLKPIETTNPLLVCQLYESEIGQDILKRVEEKFSADKLKEKISTVFEKSFTILYNTGCIRLDDQMCIEGISSQEILEINNKLFNFLTPYNNITVIR